MKIFTVILIGVIVSFQSALDVSADNTETVKPFIDDLQPGWRALKKGDFTHVNSAKDTWSWKEGVLHCTGKPVSVLRTTKQYENFEMVVVESSEICRQFRCVCLGHP